ncbi:uncharacterized protein HaLaN_10925, partial [Haematococcus lacustris]
VARDITGQRFHNGFPVVSHGPSAQALKEGWPFPVTCCWNGLVVLNAEPFSPVFEPLPATSNATNNSIPSSTVPSNSSSADTGGSEFAMSGGDIDQAKHPEVKGSTPGFLTWLHRMPFLEPNHTATALVALKNRDLAQLKQWVKGA